MTSHIVAASVDLLPIELLYRIFDDLDTETILLSIRYVCKRFHAITQLYNRYTLNFQAIDKTKFDSICDVTTPNNVTSLILSNDDQTPGQIELFLSLSPLERYRRLETVSLFQIEQVYLMLFLDHLGTISNLVSLTITVDPSSELTDSTLESLSSIMRLRTLRHLDLNLTYEAIDQLEWPQECFIEDLRLFQFLSFVTYSTILRCAPRLRTMILKALCVPNIEQLHTNLVLSSLTSLSLMDCQMDMNTIELFLSFNPSLKHLKIISKNVDLCDARRWEHFIQRKLPNLNRFELASQRDHHFSAVDDTDVSAFVAPFQTPFWLEEKQWFITALCIPLSRSIICFTLPDCAHAIQLSPHSNKISVSTAPPAKIHLFNRVTTREITFSLSDMNNDATD